MPRQHSELFHQLVTPDKSGQYAEQRLSPNLVQDRLESENLSYDDMVDLLREINYAQFDIVSTVNKQGEWLRDATGAIPLGKRMPHDAPVIEANNALLRCLYGYRRWGSRGFCDYWCWIVCTWPRKRLGQSRD